MEFDEQEVVATEEEKKEDCESSQDSTEKPFLSDYTTLKNYSKARLIKRGICMSVYADGDKRVVFDCYVGVAKRDSQEYQVLGGAALL